MNQTHSSHPQFLSLGQNFHWCVVLVLWVSSEFGENTVIPPVCLPWTTPSSQGALATMTSLINCHILHGWFSISAYPDLLLGTGWAEDPSGLAQQRMMESGSCRERSSQSSGPFERVVASFRGPRWWGSSSFRKTYCSSFIQPIYTQCLLCASVLTWTKQDPCPHEGDILVGMINNKRRSKYRLGCMSAIWFGAQKLRLAQEIKCALF